MSAVDFHFVGMGGIGMSALARLAMANGSTVSGCDVKDSPLLRELRNEGARVFIGHASEHVAFAREVVVTSAVNVKSEEVVGARDAGIPVTTRGALLARFVDVRKGIAICGTHGKTTTTAMTHAALRGGSIDAGLALGGIDVALGTNAVVGSSPWFVTEADESDGSFALLHPNIAVLTNLEEDHVSDAGEMDRLVASFRAFFSELPNDGHAVIGIDNARSAEIARLSRRSSTITFGFSESADLRATQIECAGLGSSFDIELRGENQGRVHLRVPGRINIENALAAISVAHSVGVPFDDIATGLAGFTGVRRRFDVLVASPRAIVVDDYAHHPTAIRETIAAARTYHDGPIIVAFQPHRYSRTSYLAKEFTDSLRDADTLYLAPIYAASEEPIEGISVRTIGDPLAKEGRDVRYVDDVRALPDLLAREAPHGSLILMLGAGNITDAAAHLATSLAAADTFA